MDGRAVGADGHDDEVAVPRGQLLELREQLLALGAALGAPHALLGLARGRSRPCSLTSSRSLAPAPTWRALASSAVAASLGSKPSA